MEKRDWHNFGTQLEALVSWMIDDPESFCSELLKLEGSSYPRTLRLDGGIIGFQLSDFDLARMIEWHGLGRVDWNCLVYLVKSAYHAHYVERFFASPDVVLRFDLRYLRPYRATSCIPSMLLGSRFFVHKIQNSIAEVVVTSEDGDIFTGTAFPYRRDFMESPLGFCATGEEVGFMTCRHNVEEFPEELYGRIEMLVAHHPLRLTSVLHLDRLDVSVIGAIAESSLELFGASDTSSATVLDEVVIAGFPRTHHMQRSPLMFMDGVVNSVVQDENGLDYFLISSPVAPGSSGSPVLNCFGGVVGIVHRSIETTSLGGVANFGSCIPTRTIVSEFKAGNVSLAWQG